MVGSFFLGKAPNELVVSGAIARNGGRGKDIELSAIRAAAWTAWATKGSRSAPGSAGRCSQPGHSSALLLRPLRENHGLKKTLANSCQLI